jgi:hypothetical protein
MGIGFVFGIIVGINVCIGVAIYTGIIVCDFMEGTNVWLAPGWGWQLALVYVNIALGNDSGNDDDDDRCNRRRPNHKRLYEIRSSKVFNVIPILA